MVQSSGRRNMGWGEGLGLLLLVGTVGMMMWPGLNQPSVDLPVALGTPLPPLMAAGWLNVGQGGAPGIPSAESLRGKVVVVDFWATWCGPCRAAMPKLSELYQQYQPLGVEFVGLTPEGEGDRPAIERFLSEFPGVIWPIGYGAGATFDMLGVTKLPTLAVFDPDGRVIWSGHRTGKLADVLDEALAKAEGGGGKAD